MDEQKNDEMKAFEEEIADESLNDPLPRFDDEIEFLSEASAQPKKGILAKIFSVPRLSMGWLGVLLVALVVVFLLLPRGSQTVNNEELVILKSRVAELEDNQIALDEINLKMEKMETELLKGIQIEDRLDQVESLIIAKINDLESELRQVKSQVNHVKMQQVKSILAPENSKKEPPVKKPAVKTPVAKSPTAKYHTVKRGENIYRIALKYNLTEAELMKINNLGKGDFIYPGQKLKVSP